MLQVSRQRLLTGLLALTVAAIAAHAWLSVPTGLTVTVHDRPGLAGDVVTVAAVGSVDLAFPDGQSGLDDDGFSAQWRGVWFMPRKQTVRLQVSGRGRIALELDGALLAQFPADARVRSEWSGAIGPGPHDLVITYDADPESPALDVRWAPDGGRLRPIGTAALFPGPAGLREYRTASALWWVRMATIAAWLAYAAITLPRLVLPWIVRAARRLRHPIALLRDLRHGPVGDRVRRWRAENPPRSLRELRRRLALVAAPALLGPVILILAGPHTIYSANAAEFNVPFSALLPRLLTLTAGAWAVLFTVGVVFALLSRRLTRVYAAVLFAVGLLAWVQGTLLLGEYGLLTGDELDLASEAWRDPYEWALWLGVPVLAVLFSRHVANVAPLASTVLVVLQLLLVVGSPLVAAGSADGESEEAQFERRAWREPPPAIAQLSRERNVIHLVLDSFISEAFERLLAQDREAIERTLRDFVYFSNHLGAFPTTRGSMPAMLTARAYRNEELFAPFQLKAIDQDGIFGRMVRHGYQVRSVTFHHSEHPPARLTEHGAVRYTIPTPYESYAGYVESASIQLIDLSLFRHVPHRLKARVYNDDKWLLQSRYGDFEAARRTRPSNHALFLQELIDNFTATESRPVYAFIHVAIPHPPLVMDADCRYIGRQERLAPGYLAQARCGLRLVDRLLDRLRELGIYDRSTVVLTADHGWQFARRIDELRVRTPAGRLDGIVQKASPLLAIKPAGHTGPFRISRAPTMITDVPATILDLAGLPQEYPGESVLRLDEQAARPREYAHHWWFDAGWQQPYFDLLWIFSVNGPVRRAESWQFRYAIFSPGEDLEKRIRSKRLGLTEMRDETGATFLWSEPYAVGYVPAEARVLILQARKAPKVRRQRLTVRIDGVEMARYRLDADDWKTFRLALPAPHPEANAYTVELIVDPRWRDGRRIRGAMFRPFEWSR